MKYKYKESLEALSPYSSESRSDKDETWLKLDWNESTFPLPEKIIKELNIETFNTNTYPNQNQDELISSIAKYNNVQQDNILIYAGSDEALKDIFTIFLDSSKSCLVKVPTYTQVFTYILPNTSNIILDEILNPFSTHELRIDKNNLNRSNVIYFANPNNPTGRSFPKDEIERYISSNPEKLFVIDEAYYEYSRNTMAEEVNTYKNLIITRTFSKAFSLAGLRVGYVIADIDVINILKKIKNIKSVNDIAIKAAKLVLENKKLFQQHIQEVNASRDLLIQNTKNFKKLKIFDSESNFVLLKAENSEKLKKIFYKNKILIRDKSNEVLLSDCLRITLGGSEVLKKIMNVLIDYEKS